jgi:hypothetical protein
MVDQVGLANHLNRRSFKVWYRRRLQTMRRELAQNCARMSDEVRRYGVAGPECFIINSSADGLRDLLQGIQDAQKLALFDLAMARQAESNDITRDKVAIFNTVNGRLSDMPLGLA